MRIKTWFEKQKRYHTLDWILSVNGIFTRNFIIKPTPFVPLQTQIEVVRAVNWVVTSDACQLQNIYMNYNYF